MRPAAQRALGYVPQRGLSASTSSGGLPPRAGRTLHSVAVLTMSDVLADRPPSGTLHGDALALEAAEVVAGPSLQS